MDLRFAGSNYAYDMHGYAFHNKVTHYSSLQYKQTATGWPIMPRKTGNQLQKNQGKTTTGKHQKLPYQVINISYNDNK